MKTQKSFSHSILYIGFTSDICNILSTINNCTLLLIKDKDILYSDLNNNVTIIEFYDDNELEIIYNIIKKLFLKHHKYLNNSYTLLSSLVHGVDIDKIVNLASQIIQNPIIVMNRSYKLISFSTSFEVKDTLWNENIQRGYCTYEYISALNKLDDFVNAPIDDTPFIAKCFTSPIRRMASKLYFNNKYLGLAVCLESNSSFDNIDTDFFRLFSKTLAKEIVLNKDLNYYCEKTYDSIFSDLLDGSVTNRLAFSNRIKGAPFELNSNFKVLIINLNNYKNYNYSSESLKVSLHNILPCLYFYYYKQNLVVLINMNDKYIISQDKIKMLQDFSLQNDVTIGISDTFTDLFNLNIYYHQANAALHFSSKFYELEHLAHYDNYKHYDLISSVSDQSNLMNYCSSSVMCIKMYDNKYGTDYLSTLFEYLNNSKSINATSQKLFLHKNTISYRINKIKSLFDIDFENTKNNFKIYYSCLILKYIENTQNEPLLNTSKYTDSI